MQIILQNVVKSTKFHAEKMAHIQPVDTITALALRPFHIVCAAGLWSFRWKTPSKSKLYLHAWHPTSYLTCSWTETWLQRQVSPSASLYVHAAGMHPKGTPELQTRNRFSFNMFLLML